MNLNMKYRPQALEDIVGQDSIVKIFKKQKETDNIPNAIILKGSTGVGKTTIARAFAKLINNDPNYIPEEHDAASNNGVDNIRAIADNAQTRSINSKYKVIILDEAHMLTNAAWNALLKTLEEPNKYTVIILCTTDAQKIPATISNRCQTFNLNKIPKDLIRQRLDYICNQEGFSNYIESTEYISKVANGCMREAITLLDKVSSYSSTLDINNTLTILGNYNYDTYFMLTNSLLDNNQQILLNIIEDITNKGMDLKIFIDQYLRFILDVCKYILFGGCSNIGIPKAFEDEIKNIICFDNPSQYYNYVMDKLLDLKNMLKTDVDTKSTVEVVCLQIARMV